MNLIIKIQKTNTCNYYFYYKSTLLLGRIIDHVDGLWWIKLQGFRSKYSSETAIFTLQPKQPGIIDKRIRKSTYFADSCSKIFSENRKITETPMKVGCSFCLTGLTLKKETSAFGLPEKVTRNRRSIELITETSCCDHNIEKEKF
jgi:hypothetical protein